MTEHSVVLFICLAVILVLAALLYAAGRGYLSALTGVGELRATLSRVLADTQISSSRCASSGAFSTTPTSESPL